MTLHWPNACEPDHLFIYFSGPAKVHGPFNSCCRNGVYRNELNFVQSVQCNWTESTEISFQFSSVTSVYCCLCVHAAANWYVGPRTSRFNSLVVGFADEFLVVHQVELVAGVELAAAHRTRETLEVVDVVLRPAHDLCRWNALLTARTLRTVTTTTNHTVATLHAAVCIAVHVQRLTKSPRLRFEPVLTYAALQMLTTYLLTYLLTYFYIGWRHERPQ